MEYEPAIVGVKAILSDPPLCVASTKNSGVAVRGSGRETCVVFGPVGAASMRLSSPIPAQLSPAATIAAVLSAEAMVTLVGIFATRS